MASSVHVNPMQYKEDPHLDFYRYTHFVRKQFRQILQHYLAATARSGTTSPWRYEIQHAFIQHAFIQHDLSTL
jgi:hypothetical protein